MAMRSLWSRVLRLRVSSAAGLALALLALVQLFAAHGLYRYPHLPRDDLLRQLHEGTTPALSAMTEPDCAYDHILRSRASVHKRDVLQYGAFSAAGIANGSYAPAHCRPLFSVAVLVAYRNRQSQLDVFLPYMHNFLRKQNIHYKIYLIEQQDNKPFNRGLLFNVGARQALLDGFPCLIVHDVDLLPLNEGNLYACTQQPRHLSASVDKFRFVLPYWLLVGGVLALRADHYRQLNGFSNRFHGWGGEDDDMAQRIENNHLQIQRFPREMSEYTMLVHRQQPKNPERRRVLADHRRLAAADGLNAVHSALGAVTVTPQPLLTHVRVQL